MSEFRTTHWSVVLAARGPASCATALETLCRAYWYPLYAHVRRRGHDHHAAQDLTQECFARLLEKAWLNSVAPEKGRFRTFLLTAMDHLLANGWRDARVAKRGGGQTLLSLEETRAGEERFAREAVLAGKFSSPEFVQRFRAEAEAAANLQHPNIVAIHEVGEHEGQQYFSMDYLDGQSLAERARNNPLPPRRG